MRSVTYTHVGDSSVLRLAEREIPEPGPGQVRVRIHVSGVNPTDWKARPFEEPWSKDHPHVPNQDGAGVVDAIGQDIVDLAVGSRVWVWDAARERSDGTAQDFVVLPRNQVVRLQDEVSFDIGASVGIPALTAHLALTSALEGPRELAPGALHGTTVLVAGGAGAVGHGAIQLAVWSGASVFATTSSADKATLARAAGAARVLNYREDDIAATLRTAAPNGIDLVIEVDPTANTELDAGITAANATIACYGGSPSSRSATIPLRPSKIKNLNWQFVVTYNVTPTRKMSAVRAVTAALGDGALPVGQEFGLPLARFRLEDAAQAHDAVEAGFVGKVLIDLVWVQRFTDRDVTNPIATPVRGGRLCGTRSRGSSARDSRHRLSRAPSRRRREGSGGPRLAPTGRRPSSPGRRPSGMFPPGVARRSGRRPTPACARPLSRLMPAASPPRAR